MQRNELFFQLPESGDTKGLGSTVCLGRSGEAEPIEDDISIHVSQEGADGQLDGCSLLLYK